ncbi:MAG: glycosyltransferase family 4 protein [Lacunisphaera sp.]
MSLKQLSDWCTARFGPPRTGRTHAFHPARRTRWSVRRDARRCAGRSSPAEPRRSIPRRPDYLRYYLAADVFACSSYEESSPRVVLEAMALRTPILASAVQGRARTRPARQRGRAAARRRHGRVVRRTRAPAGRARSRPDVGQRAPARGSRTSSPPRRCCRVTSRSPPRLRRPVRTATT